MLTAIAVVYGQVLGFGFVSWDDPIYITQNPHVRSGLNLASLRWVFDQAHGGNWHPLTGLSHLLDVELFGLRATGHHLTSVLLHGLNTLLLFRLLRALPLTVGVSAWVAALFALHPLHVESVAWVSARKDLLSGTFGLLALHAWLRYGRRPAVATFAWSALWLALGLMAKSMLVTLPLLFLLLDHWPLRRRQRWRWLLLEKLPLLAMSATVGVVTLLAQREVGTMEPAASVATPLRFANAAVSTVRYLAKTLWPTDLSILYPHPNLPGGIPWAGWQVAGSTLLIALLSALVWRQRRFGYLVLGWLWFLFMLLPVAGFVQVGVQAMADRYTYLPLVGLFLLVAAGLAEWVARDGRAPLRIAAAVLGVATLLACAAQSRVQVQVWRDSATLYEHALAVAPEPPELHVNLGMVLAERGQLGEAVRHYERALAIDPTFALAHAHLGNALLGLGRIEEAAQHYRQCVALAPDFLPAYYNLGKLLEGLRRLDQAVAVYEQALLVAPGEAQIHDALAGALLAQGQVEAAVGHYRRALELEPDRATAHNNLGVALASAGQTMQAITHYRDALRLEPRLAQAHRNLGVALGALGHVQEAQRHLDMAAQLERTGAP